jgi:hypothetical protein
LEALPHFDNVTDLAQADGPADRCKGASQDGPEDKRDSAFLEDADFKCQHGDDLGVYWDVGALTREFNAGSANYSCQSFATAALQIGNSTMLHLVTLNIPPPT